jgi:endoglucanase
MSAPIARRAALALIGAAALAPRLARAADGAPARAALMARGFNLPDQVPARTSQTPDREVLRWLRARGMTHVRLPVRGESVMPQFSDLETINAALDDFNRALDLLLGLDFAVSVDMHPGDDFGRLHRADPEAALTALRRGWRNLSAPIRRRPETHVFAELLNEPHTDDALWRAQVERLVVDLRGDLPKTTFIVGPAPYQRVEALAAWRPIADGNIVYAFHFYDPMAFTHQGLTWDRADPLSRLEGVPFPARRGEPAVARLFERLRAQGDAALAQSVDRALDQPWSQETIAAQFAPLAEWSRAHAAPVILNEFGVLRFKAAREARLAWLRAVRETAQNNRFGWAHWDYNQGFGLLDEAGRPDLALIEALLPA